LLQVTSQVTDAPGMSPEHGDVRPEGDRGLERRDLGIREEARGRLPRQLLPRAVGQKVPRLRALRGAALLELLDAVPSMHRDHDPRDHEELPGGRRVARRVMVNVAESTAVSAPSVKCQCAVAPNVLVAPSPLPREVSSPPRRPSSACRAAWRSRLDDQRRRHGARIARDGVPDGVLDATTGCVAWAAPLAMGEEGCVVTVR
jgi:hypothetical protein